MAGIWRDIELSGACRYRLVRRLGAGGMGEVYLATQEGPSGFSREVVLKRMRPHLADDPACREMFLDEARLTARLDHPSIVKIIELGVHDGVAFFAMEYVPGPTLSEVVRAGPPPALAAFVAREVCRALGYAHALCDRDGAPLGMVHRDVSPSNIMITPNGGVKLLDFGIAKALISLATTKAGIVKGKLAYMAPERLRGLPADHRADLFSVGVVLHEALTGYRLFEATTPEAVLELIRAPLPLPSETAPDVPPALDAICLRALAERPEDRYPTADAMADALDAVLFEARFGAAQAGAFVQRVWRPPEPGAPPPLPASSEEASTWDTGMVVPSLDPALAPVHPQRSDSDPDLVQLGLAPTAPAEVEPAAPAQRPARARRLRWRWLAAAAAAAAAIAAAVGTGSMRGADRGERAPVMAAASDAAPAWLSAGRSRIPAGADAARWYRTSRTRWRC
ncbi:MAG TPA: serine/threonine-protein kinase [Kofleriaceae bacterium]|nr:serine/threonine-protein kinase [Kofleriaceae bacterium]